MLSLLYIRAQSLVTLLRSLLMCVNFWHEKRFWVRQIDTQGVHLLRFWRRILLDCLKRLFKRATRIEPWILRFQMLSCDFGISSWRHALSTGIITKSWWLSTVLSTPTQNDGFLYSLFFIISYQSDSSKIKIKFDVYRHLAIYSLMSAFS